MPSDDPSKKAKFNVVKVGREDLYHVDEEHSPVAEEVGEEEWEMMIQTEKRSMDLNACVMT